MILCIADVLDRALVEAARETLADVPFRDGRATAGHRLAVTVLEVQTRQGPETWEAKAVKHNRQADPEDAAVAGLARVLRARIEGNELFRIAVRPRRISPLILSRYVEGMGYGTHVDDALMNGMRSDVSFTLFLSEPDAYERGELVIEDSAGEHAYKLPAGCAVAYPSTSLHRVETVRGGERLAAVGWASSHVREAQARELLFDLERVHHGLSAQQGLEARVATPGDVAVLGEYGARRLRGEDLESELLPF